MTDLGQFRCDLRNTECNCPADTCAAAPVNLGRFEKTVPLIRFGIGDFVALVIVLSVLAGIGGVTLEKHYGRQAKIEAV